LGSDKQKTLEALPRYRGLISKTLRQTARNEKPVQGVLGRGIVLGSYSGYFLTTCFTAFDVLPVKFVSPPYTALIELLPTLSVEVSKVAVPLLNVPVPSTVVPFMNETVSPLGGTGVTTAVNFTASPKVEGFGEDDSVVVVDATLEPVPVSETVCGLFGALSVKVKVPVCVPGV